MRIISTGTSISVCIDLHQNDFWRCSHIHTDSEHTGFTVTVHWMYNQHWDTQTHFHIWVWSLCLHNEKWVAAFFYSWSSVTIWCSTDVWMYPSGAYWNSRQTLYELCSEEFSQSGLRGWQREVWGKKTHTLQCRQVKRCYWRYILYIMRSLH